MPEDRSRRSPRDRWRPRTFVARVGAPAVTVRKSQQRAQLTRNGAGAEPGNIRRRTDDHETPSVRRAREPVRPGPAKNRLPGVSKRPAPPVYTSNGKINGALSMTESSAFPLMNAFGMEMDDIRRGDRGVEEVVTDLYARLRPALLAYVYHLVGSTRDAEDLVQVAFLHLFDHLSRGDDIRNVRAWLYRVAHNLAVEHAPAGQEGVAAAEVARRRQRVGRGGGSRAAVEAVRDLHRHLANARLSLK